MSGVWFVKIERGPMESVWFAWEMGWKLNLCWHMIKQMGNVKDKFRWDMMN
jgi:hypothetical protein